LYNGIFIGMLNGTGLQVDGGEKKCVLEGSNKCIYEYEFKEE